MPPDHSISRKLRAHAYQLFVRSRRLFPSAYEILSITDTPMHWLSEQCTLFTVICSSMVYKSMNTSVHRVIDLSTHFSLRGLYGYRIATFFLTCGRYLSSRSHGRGPAETCTSNSCEVRWIIYAYVLLWCMFSY